ncbi:MAG TPA: DUF5979 domain-containing protein, partial [Jiangellaceae bacterium]|nr:DUF5979 domain-containing protein [Jiangellaceae bacterium]
TFDLGVLEIDKVIEGAGSELFGAGPFEAQAVCTWDRDGEVVPIALPDDGAVVLSGENDYRVTIDNLIVGADCTVTEMATGGATSSTIAPEGGAVTIPANEAGEQQSVTVTLTNTFDVTSLEVTKEVQGNLDAPGATGPFEVELVCEREVDGEVVSFEIPGGSVRELSDDNGLRSVYELLPVGAACELTETETSDADGTQITVALEGAAPETTESTSAEVDLGLSTAPGQARAVIVNAYDADPVPPVIDDESSDEGSGVGGPGLSQTGVAAAALAGVAALLTMLGLAMLAVRRRTAQR